MIGRRLLAALIVTGVALCVPLLGARAYIKDNPYIITLYKDPIRNGHCSQSVQDSSAGASRHRIANPSRVRPFTGTSRPRNQPRMPYRPRLR